MVFEFDYVPLAIGGIGQYAPQGVIEQQVEPHGQAFASIPVNKARAQPPRLDLERAIPIWNQDPKTIENERQSPLLRLPAELKLKIWAMAYEDVKIHMSCRDDGTISNFVCNEDRSSFYGLEEEGSSKITASDRAHFLQCRCRGSMLEPPYLEAPIPDVVKTRRESMPRDTTLEKIGGMLLACREIYANARDYLWTQPHFIFPTQRLLTTFSTTVPPALFSLITKLTLHTWSDSWRTTNQSGFFGGSCDPDSATEWDVAVDVIATQLPSLSLLHLITHVAGGDSTVWHVRCKPAMAVADLDIALWTDRYQKVKNELGIDADGSSGSLDFRTVREALGCKLPGMRCIATAAVEGSRHRPGAEGCWVTRDQVRKVGCPAFGAAYIRERNVDLASEAEKLVVPLGWEFAWWVSVEERDRGAVEAGPRPWPFNHLPV